MARHAQRTLEDSPLSFDEVVLGAAIYDWQAQILFTIEEGSHRDRVKLAVVAPNAAGKSTRIVAIAALRWLYKNPKGRVVITTADSKQLDAQIMPALQSHRNVFARRGWEFLARSIRTPEGGFLLSFTTDEPGRAEGHHSAPDVPLLIIADEAKSIEEPIFEAFDRCSYNVLLLISSPGLMQGRLYNCFTAQRDQWFTFQVGLEDCPHVSQERIDDVIASYGAEHPFTRSTLYGEFMTEEEGTTFAVSLKALQALMDNPPLPRLDPRERIAFCDFAAGGDENVLAIRNGNKLEHLKCWRNRDTMAGVGQFILEFRKAGLEAKQVWGDDGGMGHVMIDALSAAGWAINRFNFGGKPGNEFGFVSRGAEAWFSFGRQVTNGELFLIRDETLIAQLTSRKTTCDSRGRIKLESKDELRARGLKSPDRADAVVGAFVMRGAGDRSNYVNGRRRDWMGEMEQQPGYSSDEAILRTLGGWVG
jgi:hypothetical protein